LNSAARGGPLIASVTACSIAPEEPDLHIRASSIADFIAVERSAELVDASRQHCGMRMRIEAL
jgi:hypothetical protein